MFRVADFFCGAGGFSEGFRQMGFDIVFGLDNWEPAVETFKHNFPKAREKSQCKDITKLKSVEDIDGILPEKVDIIIGGPPCVSFSNSNRSGKADKSEGLNLIEMFLKIVLWRQEKHGLKYWVFENVPNSRKHIKDRYTWSELDLPENGPDLIVCRTEFPLNSANYGVPQKRKRMFYSSIPLLLEKTHKMDDWITVKQVFDKLKSPWDFRNNEPLGINMDSIIEDPCYENISTKAMELTDHFYDSRVEDWRWKKSQRYKEDHGYMGKMSFPDRINRPSRTVMAMNTGMSREAMLFRAPYDDISNEDFRRPTIREIASFMSFPITFQFKASTVSNKTRLVGNAVPPKLAAQIAKYIRLKEDLGKVKHVKRKDIPKLDKTHDLTGEEWEPGKPRKRRYGAIYNWHIPNMKEHTFRVSLDNKSSNFEKNEIFWTVTLHKGQGDKYAKKASPGTKTINDLLSCTYFLEKNAEIPTDELWNTFKKEVHHFIEDNITSPENFHDAFREWERGNDIGPDGFLEAIKGIINSHFPKKKYYHCFIINDSTIRMSADEFPVRIVAGLLACRSLVDKWGKDS